MVATAVYSVTMVLWKKPHFTVITINNQDDIYGAVIMAQSHCESSRGSLDECRLSARWRPTLQTKPNNLGCYRPHPPMLLLLSP